MTRRTDLPRPVVADQDVCEDDELAGDSDKGDFFELTGGNEPSVENLHVAIVARGTEGGEIEDPAYGGPPAMDGATPLAFAGLVGDRGKAGEQCNLLMVATAELGEADEKCHSGDRSEARNREQDGVAVSQA